MAQAIPQQLDPAAPYKTAMTGQTDNAGSGSTVGINQGATGGTIHHQRDVQCTVQMNFSSPLRQRPRWFPVQAMTVNGAARALNSPSCGTGATADTVNASGDTIASGGGITLWRQFQRYGTGRLRQ